MKNSVLFSMIILLLSVSQGYSQVFQTPDTTYFQGFLTDDKGAPIDGNLSGEVTLFDVNNAAVAVVFTGNVQVVKGYFSIPLGFKTNDKNSLDVLSRAVTAEIKLNGKAFNPRVYIGSTPYSKIAQLSDSTLRIRDFAISDKNIDTNAAINGRKILPDFGNQKIVTQDSIIGKDGKFTNSITSKNAKFGYVDVDSAEFKKVKADSITAMKNLDVTGTITNSIPNAPILLSDSVKIESDVNVLGTTKLKELFVNNNLHVTNNINGEGELSIKGFSAFAKAVTLEDILVVNKDAHIKKDLTVDGLSTLNGGVSLKGEIKVVGKGTFDNIEVNESTLLHKLLTVDGESNLKITTVDGNFTVLPTYHSTLHNTKIDGTLEVNGTSTINGILHVTEESSLDKKLTVLGETNLQQTNIRTNLIVTNKTTTNDLEVKSTSNFGDGILTINTPINNIIFGKGQLILSPTPIDASIYKSHQLYINGTAYFAEAFITKDLTVENNLTVDKILTVKGNGTFNQILEVLGDTKLKNTDVDGNLTVKQTTKTADLVVTASSTQATGVFNGLLSLKDSLIVDGNIIDKGKLIISSNPNVIDRQDYKLYVDGKSYLSDATISNDLAINRDLNVVGTGTFEHLVVKKDSKLTTLDVSGISNLGITNVDGDFIVKVGHISNLQKTNISGDFDVTGSTSLKKTTISGTLDVADNSTFGKEITVNGISTLHSTNIIEDLTVSKTTKTLDLDVTHTATLHSGVISGDMDVDGTLTIKGKITGKGKMVLSPTLTDPDVYQLYVDGKTYFKEGIIAGFLTIKDSLNVTGGAQFKNLYVSGESNLNLINATGTATLKNTNIDGSLTVSNGLSTLETLIMNGDATLKKTTVNGDLDVNGTTNLNQNLNVSLISKLHETNITGDLTVSKSITTEKLIVNDNAQLKHGLISGDMMLKGVLTVDGLISGKGKMILSPTLIDPGVYQLYVDGKTYFKDGILAGALTLDEALTVNGLATFANIKVTNQSTLHDIKADGKIELPNNAIQYTELENSDNTLKIRNDNIRKVDNAKDPYGLGPDKTHLHNLAIAIFRYMGNPGDKTYEGETIYNTDGSIAVDNTQNSTKIIQNLITNNVTSVEDKKSYINNLFKDVTDINLSDNSIIHGDNITIDSRKVVIGCLEIDCDQNGNPIIKKNGGGQITIENPIITNPVFPFPITLPSGSVINSSTINNSISNNSTSNNTTLGVTTTITGTTDISGIVNLGTSTVINGNNSTIDKIKITNSDLSNSSYSGDVKYNHSIVDMKNATVTLPDKQQLNSPHIKGLANDNRTWIDGFTDYTGYVYFRSGTNVDFQGANLKFSDASIPYSIIKDVPITTNFWWYPSNNLLAPNNSTDNVRIGGGNFNNNKFEVNGSSRFDGGIGINTNPSSYSLYVNGTLRAENTAYFNGNVGIGTSSPAYKLDVSGTMRIIGQLISVSDNSNVGAVFSSNSSSPTVRIYNGTGTFGIMGGHALEIYGHMSTIGVSESSNIIEGTNNSAGKAGVAGFNLGSGPGIYGSSNTGYAIYSNGNAYVTNNISVQTLTQRSDRNLKDDIQLINDPLNKILNLTGRTYYFKSDTSKLRNRHIGFIAQEVLKILPEVVQFDGKYYSIEYSTISAVLVEAIKEQQTQIDSLRTRISKMETASLNPTDESTETKGTSKLKGGKVDIDLDSKFKDYDVDKEINVILTPKGECNGLFVAKIENDKVLVKELGNGKSDVSFYYSIIATKDKKSDGIVIGAK